MLGHYGNGWEMHPTGYGAHRQAHDGIGEYFLTGASGFGAAPSVPMDGITAVAAGLLAEIDAGGDGFATLNAADAQTKASACQRALDILALPVCASAEAAALAPGSCTVAGTYQTPAATLRSKVIDICGKQGVSVGGWSMTTKLLVGAGVVVGGVILYKALKK